MTDPSIVHATFCLERRFDARPARVFSALTTPEGKAAWFSGEHGDWELLERTMDVRAGGRERVRGRFAGGDVSDFQATYHDVIPDRRLVYAYDMYVNDHKLSVSLATFELKPDGQGTRLTLTEQGAFFDGQMSDVRNREHGTALLMDRLGRALESTPA